LTVYVGTNTQWLTVANDVVVNGNTWNGRRRNDGMTAPFAQCNQTAETMCNDGEYVCGIRTRQGCGSQWYQQSWELVCCGL
jgi:hypothetical protein